VAQMGRVEELLSRKKAIFRAYDTLLAEHPGVSLLPENDWSESSCWLYTIILKGYDASVRDRLITNLGFRGIDARPGFYPMHQMDPYREFGRGDYPVSSKLSENALSLPSSFGLSNDEITHIVEIFVDELSKFARDKTDGE